MKNKVFYQFDIEKLFVKLEATATNYTNTEIKIT